MSIVDAARDAASRLLLLDTCTITRQGDPVFNPATGQYTTPTSTVYSGVCNLTPFTGASDLSNQFGEESVNTRNYRLTVPWDAPVIVEEDIVEITSSEDPKVADRKFRVVAPQYETFQAARRLVVQDIRTS